MRPGKQLCCIQCGGSSFFPRYFCILIPSICIGNLSLPLELPGRWAKGEAEVLLANRRHVRGGYSSRTDLSGCLCALLLITTVLCDFFSSGVLLMKRRSWAQVTGPYFTPPHIYIYLFIYLSSPFSWYPPSSLQHHHCQSPPSTTDHKPRHLMQPITGNHQRSNPLNKALSFYHIFFKQLQINL